MTDLHEFNLERELPAAEETFQVEEEQVAATKSSRKSTMRNSLEIVQLLLGLLKIYQYLLK
jgi:hypothetical protein